MLIKCNPHGISVMLFSGISVVFFVFIYFFKGNAFGGGSF